MPHSMQNTNSTNDGRNNSKNQSLGLTAVVENAIAGERRHEYLTEKLVRIHGQKRRSPNQGSAIARAYRVAEQDRLEFGTYDLVFKEFCDDLTRLGETITGTDAQPSKAIKAPLGNKGPVLPAVQLKRLGEKIVELCRRYDDRWSVTYSNHVFHPHATVMLRAMTRYAVRVSQCYVSHGKFSHDLELGDLLGRLVRFVRRVCASWRYINAVNEHTKKERSNFDSSRDLIFHFASLHSRLCFLRIDLTFRTCAKDFSHSEEANRAVAAYLRSIRSKAMKRNLLPGYLGFIIKRENGVARGTHFHLMIILNGNIQRSTEYLSEKLGEIWLDRIGRDRGSFHNSYKDSNDWFFNGLGVVEYHDLEKLIGLRVALHYLSKQDCVLKVSNDKVKNFWRTPSPTGSGKKRGRKRKGEDSLRLMHRLLDGPRSKYPKGFDPKPYVLAKMQKATTPRASWSWDTLPPTVDELP